MGVDLNKIKREAPHMVDLVKKAGVNLEKKGFNPSRLPAAVVGTLDFSGSAEGLYRNGTMQEVADLAFAAGLTLDDDGDVPFSLFDSRVTDLGEINLGNCKDFVNRSIQGKRMGSTEYVSALEWIIEKAGFGGIDLGSSGGHRHGLLGRSKGGSELSIKATAPYPTLALFVTDGEPNRGTEPAIEELLTRMSQLPIFVQFIGVGDWSFSFLERLDEMEGRLIDNANFFDAKAANHDQDQMLELMLQEFPDWYAKAKQQGLLV